VTVLTEKVYTNRKKNPYYYYIKGHGFEAEITWQFGVDCNDKPLEQWFGDKEFIVFIYYVKMLSFDTISECFDYLNWLDRL